MTRKYSLAIEGEPGGYSAYVPELPAILVTGQSMEELTVRAREAIRLYWEAIRGDLSPTSTLREIEVELPDSRSLSNRPLGGLLPVLSEIRYNGSRPMSVYRSIFCAQSSADSASSFFKIFGSVRTSTPCAAPE